MARKATVKLKGVAALQRKGIFAIEVDGIVTRLTKKQTKLTGKDPDFKKSMGDVMALGLHYARALRRRVRKEGRLATRSRGYRGRRTGKVYLVKKSYARRAGGPNVAASSEEWQARAGKRRDTHDITGGTWHGLEVVGAGGARGGKAKIGMRGSSKASAGKRENVRNQIKLGTIWLRQRVNLLQPTDEEVAAMGAAVAVAAEGAVMANLGVPPRGRSVQTLQAGVDRRLYRSLMRSWVKRRRRAA